jgi:hypothetical protein
MKTLKSRSLAALMLIGIGLMVSACVVEPAGPRYYGHPYWHGGYYYGYR